MDRVIFLDVDGVLNGHGFNTKAMSCTIHQPCVRAFNRIIETTTPKVVLSSAWRYMVTGGAMTLSGFGYMLRTHGAIGSWNWLVDTTATDEQCPGCDYVHAQNEAAFNCEGYRKCVKCGDLATRANQVSRWLRDRDVKRYVVVDDDDYEFTAAGHPFVKTGGLTGLTEEDADKVIAILMGE